MDLNKNSLEVSCKGDLAQNGREKHQESLLYCVLFNTDRLIVFYLSFIERYNHYFVLEDYQDGSYMKDFTSYSDKKKQKAKWGKSYI